MTSALRRVMMVDNFDSFTFNLVQYFQAVGSWVTVCRNDEPLMRRYGEINPDLVVVSPGPGRPEPDCSYVAFLKNLPQSTEAFGVCLGMQAMAVALGGRVTYAPRLMHGKKSWVQHSGTGPFKGLPNPLQAARYHSLVVDAARLPGGVEPLAFAQDDQSLMALWHPMRRWWGVQFHPESFATTYGMQMIENVVLNLVGRKKVGKFQRR